MKTIFINVWRDVNGEYIPEHHICDTLEQAVAEYWEVENYGNLYMHTLKVVYSDLPVDSLVTEINITDYLDEEKETIEPDYEPLTGHEMGVCLGRV